MEKYIGSLTEVPSRLQRVAHALRKLKEIAGNGFAQDNKGQEFGSREDRIVAFTLIPDQLPDDWQP